MARFGALLLVVDEDVVHLLALWVGAGERQRHHFAVLRDHTPGITHYLAGFLQGAFGSVVVDPLYRDRVVQIRSSDRILFAIVLSGVLERRCLSFRIYALARALDAVGSFLIGDRPALRLSCKQGESPTEGRGREGR